MYEKLPQELKTRGSFCLWKYEERNGDKTKVPYQLNGFRADSTNKATFTDYAAAVSRRNGYDGIGIGVFGDICAIDIDHCVTDSALSDMAKDIISRMDTYTEYSPSGTGVRILFKASLPAYDKDRYYINNRQNKLEIYVAGYTNRFVTVTGNAISGTDLEERSEALTAVLEQYMRRPEKAKSHVSVPGSYLSDESVLQKAFSYKNGESFKAMWDGVIPDGMSHSEVDLSVCCRLAFFCGGDTEQMDRLFRQSALMRDKWERDDYRTATLTKAVVMCTEFYKPVGKSSAADDFNDLQQTVAALNPAENDRYPWNDIGNGRLYADVYKSIVRFVPERRQWYCFDGTHEAIIDQESFDIVQRIREGRRRVTPMGEMPILSGMLFCADCGSKLYQVRHRDGHTSRRFSSAPNTASTKECVLPTRSIMFRWRKFCSGSCGS